MRPTWVVSFATLALGCGRVGFGSSDYSAGDATGSDTGTGNGSDGGLTVVLPAECMTAQALLCDDFERDAANVMGLWDGENDLGGPPSLTTIQALSGTASLNIHLDVIASARSFIYERLTPPPHVRISYALYFASLPDRIVHLPSVFLSEAGTSRDLNLFAYAGSTTGFIVDALLTGTSGNVREVRDEATALTVGRWFLVTFDVDLTTSMPTLAVTVDGVARMPLDGPYIRDAFVPTSGTFKLGTEYSESGSVLDYQIDNVALLQVP